MPNCFQLFRKGDNTTPLALCLVDQEICKHFGADVDVTYYYHDWHDIIGYNIAVSGHDLGTPELREDIKSWMTQGDGSCPYLDILDFMEANYTSTHFYQSK